MLACSRSQAQDIVPLQSRPDCDFLDAPRIAAIDSFKASAKSALSVVTWVVGPGMCDSCPRQALSSLGSATEQWLSGLSARDGWAGLLLFTQRQ